MKLMRIMTTPMNFYPRPPRGGRLKHSVLVLKFSHDFYPRPPRGGRPSSARLAAPRTQHFYPRPPRGGRPMVEDLPEGWTDISIHALREEGDDAGIDYNALDLYFYPRPPRGGRPETRISASTARLFLSTPSARRATSTPTTRAGWMPHFYPRPPRGGRLSGAVIVRR